MKKKLLIINRAQFGYHTDSYKYCQYLKNEFDITYVCFDTGNKKIFENDINTLYVPYAGSILKKGFDFIRFCRQYIKKNNFDLVFVIYFPMASLVKLGMPSHKFILDIRTGAVGKTKRSRQISDKIMVLESKFYKNITIISDSLREKLKLKVKRCHILPLAADQLSFTDKSFKSMKLLYVGTLSSRRIEETVVGLSKFIKESNIDKADISYDVFGAGTAKEERLLNKTIKETDLGEFVKFHGRKTHDEIQSYYDNCNIGVSYVPLVDYYDCQPPTKIFEYVGAGLFCIATSTLETKKLINSDNGILCKDNVEAYASALEYIYKHKNKFKSENIRKSLVDYSWDKIINNNLKKYFKSKIV